MLIRPLGNRVAEGLVAGWDQPYKHEVMGNGIYSCPTFREAKQILTHCSWHNGSSLQTTVRCSGWAEVRSLQFIHVLGELGLQTPSWHTEQRMWSTIRGWEGSASGGRLKSSHLVQRIKAVVTKGLGESYRPLLYILVCFRDVCIVHWSPSTNEIITLWLTVAHRLWENIFDDYSEIIQLYNATVRSPVTEIE